MPRVENPSWQESTECRSGPLGSSDRLELQLFQAVGTAYPVLKDPTKGQACDRTRRSGPAPQDIPAARNKKAYEDFTAEEQPSAYHVHYGRTAQRVPPPALGNIRGIWPTTQGRTQQAVGKRWGRVFPFGMAREFLIRLTVFLKIKRARNR